MLRISNDYLINKAANSLLELGLEFLRAGRIVDWMSLVACSYEEALKANKELNGTTDKKRTKNKRKNAGVLRKGPRRAGLLRKRKQRKNKRS